MAKALGKPATVPHAEALKNLDGNSLLDALKAAAESGTSKG